MPGPANLPPRRVLVGYASAYGSTKGIANRIGECLDGADVAVDVRSVDEIDALEDYEAVILGSAIHNAKWLPPATEFLVTHAAALATRPLWLFSVSSVGDTTSFLHYRVAQLMRLLRKEPAIISQSRVSLRPRGHRNFAGAIERAHWTVPGDIFLRLCGGSYGDHSDWDDIERWAADIVTSLRSERDSALGRNQR